MRYYVISLVFFVFAWAGTAAAAELQPPTIDTKNNAIYNTITISGTSAVNTNVMIYLDGSFVDWADVGMAAGRVDYSFQISKKLIESGEHSITAIAQDRTSLLLSPPASILTKGQSDENGTAPAPTLLNDANVFVYPDTNLKVLGLTKNATRIKLFLDGELVHETGLLTDLSGTANFNYILNDLQKGKHILSAQALYENGAASEKSTLAINVEDPLPAPSLLGLENGRFLRGLSTNDTDIQVTINDKIVKEFKVNNDPSGTANFIVDLGVNATNKEVRALAIDRRGKKSLASKKAVIVYASEMQLKPSISEAAVSESAVEAPADTTEETPFVMDDEATSFEEEEEDAPDAQDGEIAGLFEDLKDEARGQSGSVDETKKQQGRLQLNLLVFILFLFGVIAWIFWVNRELIKERKELNELENKSKEN